MKYMITNVLPPMKDGKPVKMVFVVDEFEKVIGKIIADLNSVWKGMVELPVAIMISEVPDTEPLGLKIFEDNKVVHSSENLRSQVLMEELLDVFGEGIKIERMKMHKTE